MDNCAIIAGRIKEVLKHKKTSAKNMLENLDLNPQYLVQMKKAMSPQIGTLQRMADYLGVPLDYLLYGTVDRHAPILPRLIVFHPPATARFFCGYTHFLPQPDNAQNIHTRAVY